jgi:hypothetical protein
MGLPGGGSLPCPLHGAHDTTAMRVVNVFLKHFQ